MSNPAVYTVFGRNGLAGELLDSLPSQAASDQKVRIRLAAGEVIEVPASMIAVGPDGTYSVPIGPEDLRAESGERIIPVLEEELVVGKRPVETGGIRVNRRILERQETVEMPLLKDHLDVRRVIIDREVEGPQAVRRQGETTIIPIVEEVLVVEKRYRLKEEIHVSRSTRTETHTEQVTVKRQEAEIERFDADGNSVPVQPVQTAPEHDPRPWRRKSFLEDR